MTRRRLLLFGLGVAALVAVLDQALKAVVVAAMPLGSAIELLPFLALYHARNEGIAFSLFSGVGARGRALVAGAVLLFVGWLWLKTPPDRVRLHFAFAIVAGGAVGNLADRVRLGYVVDYVLFHTPVWSFAVFNLADACISVGAGLILLEEVLFARRDGAAAERADAAGKAE